MGEAKRRRSAPVDKQPSIAASWNSYRTMVMHPQAPDIQLSECRLAFYAGATVVFHKIIDSVDPGDDPTDADMTRMDNLHEEINAFAATFDREVVDRQRQFDQQQPHQRLGDAAIEASYHDKMVEIAEIFDELFNDGAKGAERKTGFVLLVFPFENSEGRCNFISNGADRRDVVTLMKEMIARFEGQPELTGRA